ncbi:hypothetical protein CI105_00515 [Candidatus Izimaplasma bacterium ZiA1]|uniref:hypothetical protein n=1 Tax=Candidatus Izimoplasma sp. ZiA1 TaxID=2024899 RepID=UPI000BAA49CC|nr:hypothetical protein CI105_00515 [Candidatus Izimaplasma bacterium ZiA1]
MAFEKLESTQQNVVKLLRNSYKKDRLSHAYLFEGERGTYKFQTALYFAQLLLCTNDDKPCGECHNCKRINNQTHPNLFIIESENGQIKKQQIIELQTEFSKTSVEKGSKIFIIKDVDKLRVESANSLLKFIEEPFPNTFGILTTTNINSILPTIISRSQIVTFHSLNKNLIKEELSSLGYESTQANVVSQITNNIDDAINILNSEAFLPIFDIVTEVYNILAAKDESVLLYFNKNSSIIYQENNASLFLSLMIMYQKDMISMIINNESSIVFTDEIKTMKNIVLYKDLKKIMGELEYLLDLLSKSHFNINRSLAFDNMLLELESR